MLTSAMDRWTAGYGSATSDDRRRARRTAGAVIVGVVAYSISVVIVFATGQEYFAIPIILVALALISCGVALQANKAIAVVANAVERYYAVRHAAGHGRRVGGFPDSDARGAGFRDARRRSALGDILVSNDFGGDCSGCVAPWAAYLVSH